MSLGTASAFLESRRLLGAACGSRLTRAGTASAFLESRRLLGALPCHADRDELPPQHFWNRDDC